MEFTCENASGVVFTTAFITSSPVITAPLREKSPESALNAPFVLTSPSIEITPVSSKGISPSSTACVAISEILPYSSIIVRMKSLSGVAKNIEPVFILAPLPTIIPFGFMKKTFPPTLPSL